MTWNTGDDDETPLKSVERAEFLFLVYERIAGKHRIGFTLNRWTQSGCETVVDEYDDPIPWDQAPREWKLRGVTKLCELIEEIASTASDLAATATDAAVAAESILRDVKGLPGKPFPNTQAVAEKPIIVGYETVKTQSPDRKAFVAKERRGRGQGW